MWKLQKSSYWIEEFFIDNALFLNTEEDNIKLFFSWIYTKYELFKLIFLFV